MNRKIDTIGIMILFCVTLGFAKVTVAIQPLGKFDTALLREVSSEIVRIYPFCEVKALAYRPIFQTAYYAPRNRWRADIILDELSKSAPSGVTKIIGILEKDISTTKGDIHDWGIFGLGQIGGKPCVVSVFRLKKSGTSEKLYRIRVKKVVIHELGHTLGLAHCSNSRCNMADGEGLIQTLDAAPIVPCKKCLDFISLMNY